MTGSRYKLWIRVAGVLLGVGAFYFALRSVHLAELTSALAKNLNGFLLLCVLAWMASILFQVWRWQMMLNAQKPVPFNSTLKLYLINRLTNLLFLFRAGEGIRVAAGANRFQINAPYLVATIINERILNLVFLALITLGLTFAWPYLERARPWLAAALLILPPLGWFAIRRIKQLDEGDTVGDDSNLLKRTFYRFMTGIVVLRKREVLRGVLFTSLGSWCCLWLGVWSLVQNLHTSNTALAALSVLLLINLAGILPLTPSSVGPFQWACIFALSYFGVAKTDAVSFSLILQAVRIVAAALLAAFGATAGYLRFTQSRAKYLTRVEASN